MNVTAKLLVLTRNSNIVCLKKEEESYQTVKRISLLHIKELCADVDALATKPFPVLSISEKCITTEKMIYIVETGHSQPLRSKESSDNKNCGI